MLTYSLVVATPFAGIEVIKISAKSSEAASNEFLASCNIDGFEILHVIEPEHTQVEIVVDLTNGMVEQVASNHPNTKIVFLDSSKDEIGSELENENSAFAPDIDLADNPEAQLIEPWVYRTAEVEYHPRMTGYYVRYVEDEGARKAFNDKAHAVLDRR